MNDLLEAADKVTVPQAIGIAFSTQVWHAEHWQARLKEAWKTLGRRQVGRHGTNLYFDQRMESPV